MISIITFFIGYFLGSIISALVTLALCGRKENDKSEKERNYDGDDTNKFEM